MSVTKGIGCFGKFFITLDCCNIILEDFFFFLSFLKLAYTTAHVVLNNHCGRADNIGLRTWRIVSFGCP